MSPLQLYISTYLVTTVGGINVEMSAVDCCGAGLDCGVEKRNIPHDEWIMLGLPTWTAARRGALLSSMLHVLVSTSDLR